MSEESGSDTYDKKAAAWKPTMPPYELFDDEKELLKAHERGEIQTLELQNGKMVPITFPYPRLRAADARECGALLSQLWAVRAPLGA